MPLPDAGESLGEMARLIFGLAGTTRETLVSLMVKGSFKQLVFSGGGTRCFWHGGFLEAVVKPLELEPERISGVSGGALSAACFIGSREKPLLEIMGKEFEGVDDNLDLEGDEPGGLTPHQTVYCRVVRDTVTEEAQRRIADGPQFQVLLSRPPFNRHAKWSTLPLLAAYQADLLFRSTPFMRMPERAGLKTELVDARQAAREGELVDLICHAACIPPVFNVQEWKGAKVCDGGLACKAPFPEPDQGKTLVLLTRRFRNVPQDDRCTFVQASGETPADKLDFTDRRKIEDTWQMGIDDGKRFLHQIGLS